MNPAAEFRAAAARLHRAKDAAYRDAWKRRGEVISILANIARKVDRLGRHHHVLVAGDRTARRRLAGDRGLAAVRRYLDGRDIEIVTGDIAGTCGRLEGKTWC